MTSSIKAKSRHNLKPSRFGPGKAAALKDSSTPVLCLSGNSQKSTAVEEVKRDALLTYSTCTRPPPAAKWIQVEAIGGVWRAAR
jgi:hypothetical protein